MTYWFCSDLHLGHANILKYAGRTLFMTKEDLDIYNSLIDKSEEEQRKFIISQQSLRNMDKTLIRNINERVKKDDILFHIGDFCFRNTIGGKKGEGSLNRAKYYEKQIKCKAIFLAGNHDKNNGLKTPIQRIVVKLGGKIINLVHDPKYADVDYEINFTGHVHQHWSFKRIRKGFSYTDCINVGVDVNNFYPVNISEILSKYCRWKKKYEKEIAKNGGQ